jgi:hypothetical protein
MLNVTYKPFMLSVVMLIIVMLNVVIFSVAVPLQTLNTGPGLKEPHTV